MSTPELSADANAILAYARKWGTPFTRTEITGIAPGAAWDWMSRYPSTMAKVDPIHELIKAKMIEVAEERRVVAPVRRNVYPKYKIYKLTGRHAVPTLAELLDCFENSIGRGGSGEAWRTEILDRFGDPRR